MAVELSIEPEASQWPALIDRAATQREQALLGSSAGDWRARTRDELHLPIDRPVVATGHQALLWHPGILAKFIAVHAAAKTRGGSVANLIVDQHVGRFGEFEAPVQAGGGTLDVATVALTRERPHVPMCRHAAFRPPPSPADLRAATPDVAEGLRRIASAVAAHANAPNAALQMGAALDELMRRWVAPMPGVTATDLVATSLAQALMKRMIEDPRRCVECYNRAVAAVPEAGIGPLEASGGDIELPLWRVEPDGRRVPAWARDVTAHLGGASERPVLLPRALFMTALVRLGMCDLFVHGTGGARYDRAMELWLREWLDVEPAPIAVVTATLRLPLAFKGPLVRAGDVARARAGARAAWHDPNSIEDSRHPSAAKRRWLDQIAAAPLGSTERRRLFERMHAEFADLRAVRRERIENLQVGVREMERFAARQEIAGRRDWAFPLYPPAMIDELADEIRRQFERT